MKLKKCPYRILRLRCGDDIITRIVGKNRNRLILERPMQMKNTTIFDGAAPRDVLCFRNWLQHTEHMRTKIPFDWVATFLTPQPEIVELYEHEKRKEDEMRMEMERLDNAPPSEKMEMLNELINKIKERKKGPSSPLGDLNESNQPEFKNFIEPGSILVNLAIPPNVFFQMISEGILENFDLSGMMEEDDEDEDDGDVIDWNSSPNKNDPEWGNKLEDWSPDVNDYFD